MNNEEKLNNNCQMRPNFTQETTGSVLSDSHLVTV